MLQWGEDRVNAEKTLHGRLELSSPPSDSEPALASDRMDVQHLKRHQGVTGPEEKERRGRKYGDAEYAGNLTYQFPLEPMEEHSFRLCRS